MARGYSKHNVGGGVVFRGQAKLIIDVLNESSEPLTTAAIARRIAPKLQTRQDPERVVAFYMSTWKKKGYVKVTDLVGPENPADSAPHSVQDEVGGIHADELEKVRMEVAIEEVHAKQLPNMSGKKLSEAILDVLDFAGFPVTSEQIAKIFNDNGYPFEEKQVNRGLGILRSKGKVAEINGAWDLVVSVSVFPEMPEQSGD